MKRSHAVTCLTFTYVIFFFYSEVMTELALGTGTQTKAGGVMCVGIGKDKQSGRGVGSRFVTKNTLPLTVYVRIGFIAGPWSDEARLIGRNVMSVQWVINGAVAGFTILRLGLGRQVMDGGFSGNLIMTVEAVAECIKDIAACCCVPYLLMTGKTLIGGDAGLWKRDVGLGWDGFVDK
ncbi:MAG: hypothetical protein BM485_10320 [Desulfobulbaceae bacterium DB1]|nr:MAG: hypothetical protein BM485_10320 [Desulfobulbaceae bacterium DB1]